jgi:hypothetical protein
MDVGAERQLQPGFSASQQRVWRKNRSRHETRGRSKRFADKPVI